MPPQGDVHCRGGNKVSRFLLQKLYQLMGESRGAATALLRVRCRSSRGKRGTAAPPCVSLSLARPRRAERATTLRVW